MRRRRLLGAVALSVLPAVGCVRPEPAPERTETRSMPAVSLAVRNETEQRQRVSLSIASAELCVFDDTVACPAAGTRSVDPDLNRVGEYDLVVAVAGGVSRAFSFALEASDLRTGPTLTVTISTADRVDLTTETASQSTTPD